MVTGSSERYKGLRVNANDRTCLKTTSPEAAASAMAAHGNSLVLPYGVGIVGMVGNELGKIHEAQFFPN